jgi:hypothetical protein
MKKLSGIKKAFDWAKLIQILIGCGKTYSGKEYIPIWCCPY